MEYEDPEGGLNTMFHTLFTHVGWEWIASNQSPSKALSQNLSLIKPIPLGGFTGLEIQWQYHLASYKRPFFLDQQIELLDCFVGGV